LSHCHVSLTRDYHNFILGDGAEAALDSETTHSGLEAGQMKIGKRREILDLVLAGIASKNIAADLHISQRTVDNHRAAIMRKVGAKSLSALIRVALAAV
jgi:FixJ family two-component response regulator